jgi:hypothetical protein
VVCRFFEHQIHWFSIFNSFMMVVFLCGLVALILMRTLKQDYAKARRRLRGASGRAVSFSRVPSSPVSSFVTLVPAVHA